jgi:PAS domain S-box-containing protein
MADRCGISAKELMGRKCFDVIHDTMSLPGCCPYAKLLEFQESHTIEFESNILHGSFEVSMSPVLNKESQVKAIVHVARESDNRFSVFMEHLPLAVSIKEESGRVIFANEYLKELFREKNLIGLTAHDLLPPEVASKIAQDDQEALVQGLGLYKDIISDLEGNELVFDTYKFPIPRSDGTNLLGTISLDVTEKRRQERRLAIQQKQLEEINSSLETIIEKAVTELRKKDNILIQQSRLTAMGEMISAIAHQWRQPLNNIGLIVQNLQLAFKSNDLSIEELDEDVSDTMKVLQQISETIDDFRNFFSFEENASTFSINEQVSRAISFIEPSFKSKGISIELVEEPDVTAEGYPNEYLQAVLNIILNARDELLERHVPLPLISIRTFTENGRSVVTIRDNGGGIPEDALPKIFDPYFTTKHSCKGTGIGLYMSKMIIEKNMHGGLAACNLDVGTEFRIEV